MPITSQPSSRVSSLPSGSSVVTNLAGEDTVVEALDEDLYPLSAIGSGSFATVYDFRGSAFKVVSDPKNNACLRDEYQQLKAIHRSYGPASAGCPIYFCLPAVEAYYDPQTNELRHRSHRLPELFEASSAASEVNSLKSTFAIFSRLCHGQAIYLMQRLTPIAYNVAKEMRAFCYPEPFRTQPVPTICRLYLGRDRPIRIFNQKTLPLDRERYGLMQMKGFLPRIEFVAQAMGRSLACFHWKGYNDARDVEFVLAGDSSYGTKLAFWIIDFNRTSSFADNVVLTSTPLDLTTASHEMSRILARPFFANDPYYPRPRQGDVLYERFKFGYLDGAGIENQDRARLFLHVIEEEQQEKDEQGIRS